MRGAEALRLAIHRSAAVKIDRWGETEYRYDGDRPTHGVGYLWPDAVRVIGRTPAAICEIGCGNGAFARHLASLGHEVTAIDSSSSGIRHAAATASRVRFFRRSVYDACPAEWRDAFDVVVAIEVIEHLMFPREMVRRAREMLRAGGRLLISTPYHGFAKNVAIAAAGRFDSHFSPLWDGGHVKFFSKSTLGRLVGEELVVERMWGAGRVPPFWRSLFLLARKTGAGRLPAESPA